MDMCIEVYKILGKYDKMLPMYKKKLEEMNKPLRLNLLSNGLVELVEHLIGMFLL